MKGIKTTWTTEMDAYLQENFPTKITKDLIPVLGVSLRTIIRRARELKIEKEKDFLEKNRIEISKRAQANKKPNPHKGDSSFRIPGGEKHQFKKGQERHPVDYAKIHEKRNETIRKDKLRLKYGLKQQTKMKLVNFY
jgi:hypothetical protein